MSTRTPSSAERDGGRPVMAAPPPGAADAPLPPAMAARASDLGVAKAELDFTRTFVLAVLAGAFISLGAMFATVATADAANLPFGITRVVGGVVFSLGLVLVVVAGAELFTGNNLIVMAWADRRIRLAPAAAQLGHRLPRESRRRARDRPARLRRAPVRVRRRRRRPERARDRRDTRRHSAGDRP